MICCTSCYASAGINRCPLPSVALTRRRASHEVVLGGCLLVAELGVLAVLACVVVRHAKTVRPTVIFVGFVAVWIGVGGIVMIVVVVVAVFVIAVLVLAENKVLEGRDVVHCCLELCRQVCVGRDHLQNAS